jgi:glycosyltransferase involved in cell wall biosynthesis
MACGTACIAFDCPSGPAEIVRHEHTGLLVPPGDVEALRIAMVGLAADSWHRTKLAQAAAADVSVRFRAADVMGKWLKLFGALPGQSRENPIY